MIDKGESIRYGLPLTCNYCNEEIDTIKAVTFSNSQRMVNYHDVCLERLIQESAC